MARTISKTPRRRQKLTVYEARFVSAVRWAFWSAPGSDQALHRRLVRQADAASPKPSFAPRMAVRGSGAV